MKKSLWIMAPLALALAACHRADACTGITLEAGDGAIVMSRTFEWAGNRLDTQYSVFPRNMPLRAWTPTGQNGLRFKTKHGFVSLTIHKGTFTVDGLNEKGLSAGLFFFPTYGSYVPYQPANNHKTISDMEFLTFVLSQFETVDEVKEAIQRLDIVTLFPETGAVHYRIGDSSGKRIVIEIVNGQVQIFDNPLGVITNGPGFAWHMTNLNNYVALIPGFESDAQWGNTTLHPIGHGAGLKALPGDPTSPSRFVRAALYQTTAPTQPTARDTVVQSFSILNAFDIPIGIQHPVGHAPKDVPAATQMTVASDLINQRLYYRTAWNSTIRMIDLKNINFDRVEFQVHPLDRERVEPIETLKIR